MIWNEIEELQHKFNSWRDLVLESQLYLQNELGLKRGYDIESPQWILKKNCSNSNNLIKIEIINSNWNSKLQKEASAKVDEMTFNYSDSKMAVDSDQQLSREEKKLQYYLKLFQKREEQEIKKKNKKLRMQNSNIQRKKWGRKRKGEKKEPMMVPPVTLEPEILKIELWEDDVDYCLFQELKEEYSSLNNKTNSKINNSEQLLLMHSNSEITLSQIVKEAKWEMGPPAKRMSITYKKHSKSDFDYSINSSVVKSLENSNSNKINSDKNTIEIEKIWIQNKSAKELFIEGMINKTKQIQIMQRRALNNSNWSKVHQFETKKSKTQFKQTKQKEYDLNSSTKWHIIQNNNIWPGDAEYIMMKRDDKDSEIQSQNTTYFAENEEAQYCPLSPSIWGHKMFDEMSDFSNLRKREIKRLFKIEKCSRPSNFA